VARGARVPPAHEAQRMDGGVHRPGARVPRRARCSCSPSRASRTSPGSAAAHRAERERAAPPCDQRGAGRHGQVRRQGRGRTARRRTVDASVAGSGTVGTAHPTTAASFRPVRPGRSAPVAGPTHPWAAACRVRACTGLRVPSLRAGELPAKALATSGRHERAGRVGRAAPATVGPVGVAAAPRRRPDAPGSPRSRPPRAPSHTGLRAPRRRSQVRSPSRGRTTRRCPARSPTSPTMPTRRRDESAPFDPGPPRDRPRAWCRGADAAPRASPPGNARAGFGTPAERRHPALRRGRGARWCSERRSSKRSRRPRAPASGAG
jgi:hypothetical protein